MKYMIKYEMLRCIKRLRHNISNWLPGEVLTLRFLYLYRYIVDHWLNIYLYQK